MNTEFVAVRVKGKVVVLNDSDELGCLIEQGIEHETLGDVCDFNEYGDNCNRDCQHFCHGTCPATPVRDCEGRMWHVLINTKALNEKREQNYTSVHQRSQRP